jgi:hypothetical protein
MCAFDYFQDQRYPNLTQNVVCYANLTIFLFEEDEGKEGRIGNLKTQDILMELRFF